MAIKNEYLQNLSREQVQAHLIPIPKQESYSSTIAADLSKTVIGQDAAMKAIAGRVALADSQMNDPNRPLSTMFFAGPTGTGKTESAHALADVLFHDPNSNQLRIVDCAEFSQSHMISRFTGAPPSYVGYGEKPQIDAEFLSKKNIVVFDEIEKAHPSFHRLLLGIMESGRLAIRNGTELSFANTYMVLTSNIGAKDMQKARKGKSSIGFTKKDEAVDLDAIGKKALIEHFSDIPEFLGRIDEIVVFNELAPEHYEAIFWKFLHRKNAQIKERMKKNAPYLSATQEAKNYFLGRIDKQFGARDLRGLMDREIFQKMADLFMQIDLTGKPIVIDVEDGESVFYTDDSIEQELVSSVVLFEQAIKEVTV